VVELYGIDAILYLSFCYLFLLFGSSIVDLAVGLFLSV
jgi:hypothetical protein